MPDALLPSPGGTELEFNGLAFWQGTIAGVYWRVIFPDSDTDYYYIDKSADGITWTNASDSSVPGFTGGVGGSQVLIIGTVLRIFGIGIQGGGTTTYDYLDYDTASDTWGSTVNTGIFAKVSERVAAAALLPNGNIVIAVQGLRVGGLGRVYVSESSDGITWTAATIIPSQAAGYNYRPVQALASPTANRCHIMLEAWTVDGNGNITTPFNLYCSTYLTGGTIGTPQLVTNDLNIRAQGGSTFDAAHGFAVTAGGPVTGNGVIALDLSSAYRIFIPYIGGGSAGSSSSSPWGPNASNFLISALDADTPTWGSPVQFDNSFPCGVCDLSKDNFMCAGYKSGVLKIWWCSPNAFSAGPVNPSAGTVIGGDLYSVQSADDGATFAAPVQQRTFAAPSALSGVLVFPGTTDAVIYLLVDTVNFYGDATQKLLSQRHWFIAAPAPPPIIACPINSRFTVGAFFSAQIIVSGGTPPYTFAIIAGVLPTGLSLDVNTGLISGIPTETGTFSVTIEVTDSLGATADTSACPLIQCTGQRSLL